MRAVGPVKLDLLARGVEAGRVPPDAFVRHEAWKVWRPVADLADLRAPDQAAPTDDAVESSHPCLADETHDALLCFMTAAVARGAADAALVHQVSHAEAVVVGAHGPPLAYPRDMIGLPTPLHDPAMIAAVLGETVVVGEGAGAAGAAVAGRLARLAPGLEGGVLIPIRVGGGLVAALELGRGAPFTSAQIASIEALATALEAKLAGSS